MDSGGQCLDLSTGEIVVFNLSKNNSLVGEYVLTSSFVFFFLGYCSEGKSLTKEDEKTYWGTISYKGEDEVDGEERSSKEDGAPVLDSKDAENLKKDQRLAVKGSVIYGYGLEPQPVGRFVMIESSSMNIEDDDDDDESGDGDLDDFSDWSNAFQ